MRERMISVGARDKGAGKERTASIAVTSTGDVYYAGVGNLLSIRFCNQNFPQHCARS